MRKLCKIGGSVPGSPATDPESESALVSAGSSFVPTPISPPGPTSSTMLAGSAINLQFQSVNSSIPFFPCF